ncbi:MAG: two component transcriptional regulator protein [Qinghai Lake virophage]|uniref:Two component transcriptional regulator protein n=1 Tax=Qinghai Lake virophage TaxID=1516115 RepID=A0A0R5K4T3_9VIRU|nr:MAG: two component transcriptional regulator protein [Qinghai Lake virophage]
MITIIEDEGSKKLFIHYGINEDGYHFIIHKEGDEELFELLQGDGSKFRETYTPPTLHYKLTQEVMDTKGNLVDMEIVE